MRNLEILLLAVVPHKSWSWLATLDLLFKLDVKGCQLLPVNDVSKDLAPAVALGQMGKALLRLISEVAVMSEEDRGMVFAKLDIMDS